MSAKIRLKCPHCKEVVNIEYGLQVCPKCHNSVATENQASIYLYRQGSFFGIAGGFGVYINGEPMGYIGNKELLKIPVPYGCYIIHCAAGMNRKCKDLQINLSPEHNVGYAKVHMKMGFWTNSFVVEPVDPNLLDL